MENLKSSGTSASKSPEFTASLLTQRGKSTGIRLLPSHTAGRNAGLSARSCSKLTPIALAKTSASIYASVSTSRKFGAGFS